jgi:hypothetical protein
MNRVRLDAATRVLSLAAVIAVTVTAPAAAQRKDPRAGVEIGGRAAYLTVPKGVSRKLGPGGVAGLFAVVPLVGTYKLQPEVLYEYRESEVLGVKRRYEYFTGALLVRVSLFKGLYITEGPAYSIPRRALVGSRDVTDNTRQDFSMVIGVGKRWTHVALEGRWISEIRSLQKTLEAGDVASRHRSIGLVFAIF